MNDEVAKNLLINLGFSSEDVVKLNIFKDSLLKFNKDYNLISKSTEKSIWSRHILDSAQILNLFNINTNKNLIDLGTGAGFPGLIIAIFNKNIKFHVKLYEKSSIKRKFLQKIRDNLNIQFDIGDNVYSEKIEADIIVCRAFKKINRIIDISREIPQKPHKIIILKGKNAQEEINKVSLGPNYSYKLVKSITDNDSKIIVIDVKKNG